VSGVQVPPPLPKFLDKTAVKVRSHLAYSEFSYDRLTSIFKVCVTSM